MPSDNKYSGLGDISIGHTFRPLLIKSRIHKCHRCSYEWCGRIGTVNPKNCPSCKSPYWNRVRKQKVKEAVS